MNNNKYKLRKSNIDDLESLYNLQSICFNNYDRYYKNNIRTVINNGIVIEIENEIIGFLLQGNILACDSSHLENNFSNFIPINNIGDIFKKNNEHIKEIHGIIMICINPKYRKLGYAKMLIKEHIEINKNKKYLCLHSRESNVNAHSLYNSMNYKHIANITDFYLFPTEKSFFYLYRL